MLFLQPGAICFYRLFIVWAVTVITAFAVVFSAVVVLLRAVKLTFVAEFVVIWTFHKVHLLSAVIALHYKTVYAAAARIVFRTKFANFGSVGVVNPKQV